MLQMLSKVSVNEVFIHYFEKKLSTSGAWPPDLHRFDDDNDNNNNNIIIIIIIIVSEAKTCNVLSVNYRSWMKYTVTVVIIYQGKLSSTQLYYTPCLNKNCATIHLFISLIDVDRFLSFFYYRIFHEMCNKIDLIFLITL